MAFRIYTNVNDVIANFTRLAETERNKVKDVIKTATLKVERDAKTNAPVDTGYLRNNIQSEIDGLNGVIVSGAEYSASVEFGTTKRSPKPFLFPAVENARIWIREELRGLL